MHAIADDQRRTVGLHTVIPLHMSLGAMFARLVFTLCLSSILGWFLVSGCALRPRLDAHIASGGEEEGPFQ